MSTCPPIERLERFAANEPLDDGPGDIAAHVDACEGCREQLDQIRRHLRLEARVLRALPSADSAETRATPTSAAVSAAADEPPASSFPGFEMRHRLSTGGQGSVYLAIQNSTRRKVAIKVLRDGHFANPAERARFEREVQILGQLKHPNIVTIYDSGAVAGNAYFVMDYISGSSLDEYVRDKQLSIEPTLTLFRTICEAVHAAHLRGIIHRDLKPSNIRVNAEGVPFVLDFGLAKLAAVENENTPVMTMTGQFMGTLPWASPEQAEGQSARIDIRSDVYSLGVVLYQVLTGRFPYEVDGSAREVLDRIVHSEPARPRSVSPHLDDEVETIVLKCLSKERERRYQSAGELARDVARYLAGEPIEAKRDSALYMLKKSLRRYRLAGVVLAAFAALVATSLIVTTRLYQSAERRFAEARNASECLEMILRERGNLDRAIYHFERRLERAREEHGESHPEVATRMHLLGATCNAAGYEPEAEEYFRRALAIRRRVLPARSPQIAQSMMALGTLLQQKDEFEEAAELFTQALEIPLGASPRDRLNLLACQLGLAVSQLELGQLEAAEPTLRSAYAELTEQFDDAPPPLVRTVVNSMVRLLRKKQAAHPADADADELQVWRDRLRALPPPPPPPPPPFEPPW